MLNLQMSNVLQTHLIFSIYRNTPYSTTATACGLLLTCFHIYIFTLVPSGVQKRVKYFRSITSAHQEPKITTKNWF